MLSSPDHIKAAAAQVRRCVIGAFEQRQHDRFVVLNVGAQERVPAEVDRDLQCVDGVAVAEAPVGGTRQVGELGVGEMRPIATCPGRADPRSARRSDRRANECGEFAMSAVSPASSRRAAA